MTGHLSEVALALPGIDLFNEPLREYFSHRSPGCELPLHFSVINDQIAPAMLRSNFEESYR